MPHRSFAAARISEEREPITFDFGVFAEERFTVVPDPSLGDVFDLYDLPDINEVTKTMPGVIRTISRFIRRMLDPVDRPRFDQALYRIPSTQMFILVDTAAWIAEQVMPVPSVPPSSSSSGRDSGGKSFKPV